MVNSNRLRTAMKANSLTAAAQQMVTAAFAYDEVMDCTLTGSSGNKRKANGELAEKKKKMPQDKVVEFIGKSNDFTHFVAFL